MMERSSESSHGDNRGCCNHTANNEVGVRQTLSEMEFERGIWYAAQNNDLERVEMLMRKGISVNVEDSAGYTALHYAARGGHSIMCELLLNNGARVNALTRCGRATPLHRSSMRGMIRTVELLLKRGADPNLQDSDGYTALHRAVLTSSQTVCNQLLSVTDLTIRDNCGRTAFELARERQDSSIVRLFDDNVAS